jgi:hypothetical protein
VDYGEKSYRVCASQAEISGLALEAPRQAGVNQRRYVMRHRLNNITTLIEERMEYKYLVLTCKMKYHRPQHSPSPTQNILHPTP